MTKYYHPKRTRNVYDPASDTPFALSRSKLDLFLECPRCFHLDRRLGVGRPSATRTPASTRRTSRPRLPPPALPEDDHVARQGEQHLALP